MAPNVELDYALLAEWARVNATGTLTVIDGSFLRVHAPVGTLVPLAVAGRVRFLGEPFETTVRVQFELTEGPSISFEVAATAEEEASYGDDRRHVLFALNTQLPVLSAGRCKVSIFLNGVLARDLYFAMELQGSDEAPQ